MIGSHQQQNQGLPDIIRVKVLRGFRGHIDGRFGIAVPGDVVEVPRELALQMRGAHRAVMTEAELKRQTNYLPERKRPENVAADPARAQMVAMTKAFEGLSKVVEKLVAAQAATPAQK